MDHQQHMYKSKHDVIQRISARRSQHHIGPPIVALQTYRTQMCAKSRVSAAWSPRVIQGLHQKAMQIQRGATLSGRRASCELIPLRWELLGGRYGVTGDQKVGSAGAVLGTMAARTRWTPCRPRAPDASPSSGRDGTPSLGKVLLPSIRPTSKKSTI